MKNLEIKINKVIELTVKIKGMDEQKLYNTEFIEKMEARDLLLNELYSQIVIEDEIIELNVDKGYNATELQWMELLKEINNRVQEALHEDEDLEEIFDFKLKVDDELDKLTEAELWELIFKTLEDEDTDNSHQIAPVAVEKNQEGKDITKDLNLIEIDFKKEYKQLNNIDNPLEIDNYVFPDERTMQEYVRIKNYYTGRRAFLPEARKVYNKFEQYKINSPYRECMQYLWESA